MSQNIYKLIPEIMGEVGAIGKNGFNSSQKYYFRSIDDLYNAFQPVFKEKGVFIVPTVIERTEDIGTSKSGSASYRVKLRIKFTLFATDGSFVESITEGEAIDTSDKATNKAMTAAFKYMLIQVFCLSVESEKESDTDLHHIENTPSSGNFLITFGKDKGKRIKEIPNDKLIERLQWLDSSVKSSGKPLFGAVLDFYNFTKAYLEGN